MELVNLLLAAACLIVLLPAAWMAVQVLSAQPQSALLHPGDRPDAERAPLAVLVPAHNEAGGLGATLQALLAQLLPHDRLLVVADNCSDATASIARAHGAEVLERHDDLLRGKGHALAAGFAHLDHDPRAVLVIVDADCLVAPGALQALANQVAATGRPAQALYLMMAPRPDLPAAPQGGMSKVAEPHLLMSNPPGQPGTRRQRFSEFAWRIKNWLRPLGLYRLGLPCQLMGSGMAFPWALLQQHSLASGHLVEDMQLGLALAEAGHAPRFCPQALVTSLFPTDAQAQARQRTRWEHGHLSMITQALPRLLRQWLRRPNRDLLAMALDVAIPPLSLLALACTLAVAVTSAAAGFGASAVPLLLALLALGLFALATLVAWQKVGRALLSGGDIVKMASYLAWKLPIYLGFVSRRQSTWVRTQRDQEAPAVSAAAKSTAAVPERHPPMTKQVDFTRDVVALFGIPFDMLSADAAEQRVLDAMANGRKLFMSTPNLNFVALCQRDEAFRESVLVSDLSVVDGSGVMLLAKLMGTPMPERIAGSTLFDNLVRRAPRALRVFLFGGAGGVAATAADKLNQRTACNTAVGYLSPGFGDMVALTEPGQLDEIRRTRPNFLLVALGAQKGQRWILENWDQLPTCVVSHLGATINFIAGTVVRAPRRIQQLGLEWAWRIKEEPKLWHRYASDAKAILKALSHHWLQQFVVEPLRLRGSPDHPPGVGIVPRPDGVQLTLSGHWHRKHGMQLAIALQQVTSAASDVQLYLTQGTRLDPYIVGKLLLLAGHQSALSRVLMLHADEPALLQSVRRQGLLDVPRPDKRYSPPLHPSYA